MERTSKEMDTMEKLFVAQIEEGLDGTIIVCNNDGIRAQYADIEQLVQAISEYNPEIATLNNDGEIVGYDLWTHVSYWTPAIDCVLDNVVDALLAL